MSDAQPRDSRVPSLAVLGQSPRRIVSMAPSNTEILYALGAGDRLVGVSRYCDYPERARTLPRCGGFANPDIAEILALRPDLVLAQSFLQEDAVKALVHAEIRVVAFAVTSVAELLEDILLLGRLVDRKTESDTLVAGMQRELVQMQQRGDQIAAQVGRRPQVYLEEWGPSTPYYLAGDFAADMLAIAGAENAFADRPLRCPSPQRTVTEDDIIQRAPDMILAAWCGYGDRVDLPRIARRPGFAELAAVKRGWVRAIDDRFVMRPGPRIVEGVRRIQAQIQQWAEMTGGPHAGPTDSGAIAGEGTQSRQR